ncbi:MULTISPECIES: helix-turn-helix transcriptional regulator [unclassified Cryobacterium]|uniref:helix-turn-helix domain-containing protein n=1 Tax=unclassified Cryobacterium TaxID=2649013 RepID=UPI00141BE3C9|nr:MULTISPECIES: helix-turn-helix transcriptional regulator [unclassified Cryobacterium]
MTNYLAQVGIGERIQAIRKQHGIRWARALAELIPGNNVTESIVQNIEAGRKRRPSRQPTAHHRPGLPRYADFPARPDRHIIGPARHRQRQLELR